MNINKAYGDYSKNTVSYNVTINKKPEQSTYKQAAQALIQDILPDEDTVNISPEAKEKDNKKDLQTMLEELRQEMQFLREGLQQAAEAGEGMAEAWKEKIKCMQIAMRIISGNKVPEEDHRFLRDRDMELYARAITMKIQKPDPDEYDRLSEDEKDDADYAIDGSVDAAPDATGAESETDVSSDDR